MKFWKQGAVALLALGAALPISAQEEVPSIEVGRDNTGAGTTAAEFLLLGAGARGMAIGPAFSALTRDVESLYYNPAGLPLMGGLEVGFTMMPYFADTNYLWAGMALPLAGGEYGFGLSIANFGFSDAPIYDETDQENESELTYDVAETVIGLSFAHAFIDRFTGGFTVKYISDNLGQASASGFAFDIGTNYHAQFADRPISFAFVIQNLGTTLQHSGAGLDFVQIPESPDPAFPTQPVDPSPARFQAQSSAIPVVFRFSAAYDVVSSAANRLTMLGEFNEQYNNKASFGFGSEFAWTPENAPVTAALRGSYAYQPDNSLSDDEEAQYGDITDPDAGLDGLTLGAGLGYNLGESSRINVDYAWRNFGVLGARSVFTVGFGRR
jgi:hypothetical protein